MKIIVLASASILAFATPAFAQSYSNVSSIEQIGQLNTTNVTQYDDNNLSVVEQNGHDLDATVSMATGSGGQNNKSYITQTSHDDSALTEINGNSNTSAVLQQASAYVSGSNLAETRITSDDSQSYITQSGSGNYSNVTISPGSSYGFSYVNQDGASNEATVAIGDDSNTSLIYQVFDHNTANVFQVGQNNLSLIAQNGYGNIANVDQR